MARYVAKYGEPHGRAAKVVLVASVPPIMLKTEKNPGGLPIEVFDGFRKALAENRAQFYLDVASGTFYGFNRPQFEGLAGNHPELVAPGNDGCRRRPLRRHQGFLGGQDQTDDLKAITVPTLVMQGDDDQIVPYMDASLLQAKLLKTAR